VHGAITDVEEFGQADLGEAHFLANCSNFFGAHVLYSLA
jgi:hypothetical protein